jgi:DNA-directed RNA polymerase I, II, and III subunit RPABC2
MSSAIPALPKKTQIRNPGADDSENEEDIAIDSGSESGDDDAASSVASDDDTASVAATSDESDNDADAGAAAAGDSDDADAEAEADADADADAAGGSDDEARRGDVSKTNKKKRAAASASGKKNLEDDMTLLGVPHGIHFEDDEDDEDDDDEDANKDSSEYFQKLKSSVRESYIDTYHPESLSHNYDEIQTLARVVRNSAGVIVDDLHRTIPIMTKYEKTRILGQRAKQINEGAPTFIKIDSTVIDGYLIAVKELEQKKTPFIIRRPLPNGGSEYWRVQDLEIL